MAHICYSCGKALYVKLGYLQCINLTCRLYQKKQFTKNEQAI